MSEAILAALIVERAASLESAWRFANEGGVEAPLLS